jgi:hypothetical protein
MADLVQAVCIAAKKGDQQAIDKFVEWTGVDGIKVDKKTGGWLDGLPNNLRIVASKLLKMQQVSRKGNRSRVEQHEIKGFLQSRGPF